MPPEEALRGLAAQFEGHACARELTLMSAAVAVNRATGGPLAPLLEQLAATLGERHRLKEQVDALTAQGRTSGWIVGLLPFFLLLALGLMDPVLVGPMFTTAQGVSMLAVGLLLEGVGAFLIYRIVSRV
jgi:tight adherence protein B